MKETKLTPMMEQYLRIKKEYPDEVLFFRLGDFYEMFLDDAKIVSKILNITLTKRNGIPMCGIPYHAAKTYVKRLLDEGKKIAICEQTKMPEGKGEIATREVVSVISPGTVVEDEFLDKTTSSYILSVTIANNEISCAYCELSNAALYSIDLPFDDKLLSLKALIEQLHPKEVIVDDEVYYENKTLSSVLEQYSFLINKLPSWHFTSTSGYERLTSTFETLSTSPFGLNKKSTPLLAIGGLLYYIETTNKKSSSHLINYTHIHSSSVMSIDESTRRNLELEYNLQDGKTSRTLFSAINDTVTSSGARLLRSFISSPLHSIEEINWRQEKVKWFIEHKDEATRLSSLLAETRDLTRLTSRLSLFRHTPQDMISISSTLTHFFTIMSEYPDFYSSLLSQELHQEDMHKLLTLLERIEHTILPTVSSLYIPHSIIKDGSDEELDELRRLMKNGNETLQAYVEEVKKEVNIPQIKLSYNKIIGHFLEITKAHTDSVPSSFYRKQTLVNAERFTTDRLIELEVKIKESEAKAQEREHQIYDEIVLLAKESIPLLYLVGSFLSLVDVLQSFARTAKKHHYVAPVITEDASITIVGGRHPVVEQFTSLGSFIANPLTLNDSKGLFCLITGPNMAGKSTYLRQNALIVLLSHIGSYVPAEEATIGLTDALFCRVGASDNLARGESTFLIEMQEAAYILRNATVHSLVIMDEIGRGTSTQDGMSIAYAVMRKLVEMRVKTLFATHYHELTMMDTSNMQLITLAVSEQKKNIIFLRKIIEGVATSSYGLHVAKMAGIPKDVLSSASKFLNSHYASYAIGGNVEQLDLFKIETIEDESPIFELIRSFPLENSTPIQAFKFLEELQQIVEESE
ncbi:MAG: DNA mismatch repair protein MutS [Spirochaetia bacterium]|nr:DNA mismatch repair protein MutS [Spirochaetia bacterium]